MGEENPCMPETDTETQKNTQREQQEEQVTEAGIIYHVPRELIHNTDTTH